jgi:hypothetical protein
MPTESRHVSEWIDRPAADVYEYASNPANLPNWAPGLGRSVENVDGQWFVETDSGRVGVAFAERNEYGVLDHDVTRRQPGIAVGPRAGGSWPSDDRSGTSLLSSMRDRPGGGHAVLSGLWPEHG